jgi:hypothetical protein
MKRKILRVLTPVLLTLTLLGGLGTLAAHASTGDGSQWRALAYTNNPYMNAWGGGGGYVNDYDNQTLNNDFTMVGPYNNGYWQLEFTPGNCTPGSLTCLVVADYGNNSGIARAGTYTNINGAPWGSYFQPASCNVAGLNGYTFKNVHWGGYLDPSGIGNNGSPIYLNGSPAYCWVFYGPA